MKRGRRYTPVLRVIRIIHMLRDGLGWRHIGQCQNSKTGSAIRQVADGYINRVMHGPA